MGGQAQSTRGCVRFCARRCSKISSGAAVGGACVRLPSGFRRPATRAHAPASALLALVPHHARCRAAGGAPPSAGDGGGRQHRKNKNSGCAGARQRAAPRARRTHRERQAWETTVRRPGAPTHSARYAGSPRRHSPTLCLRHSQARRPPAARRQQPGCAGAPRCICTWHPRARGAAAGRALSGLIAPRRRRPPAAQ